MKAAWLAVAWLAATSVAGAGKAPSRCSAEIVYLDVRASLVGSVEISTLRIRWNTMHECKEVQHYDIIERDSKTSRVVERVSLRGSCGVQTDYLSEHAYVSGASYAVEVHATDGTVRTVDVVVN